MKKSVCNWGLKIFFAVVIIILILGFVKADDAPTKKCTEFLGSSVTLFIERNEIDNYIPFLHIPTKTTNRERIIKGTITGISKDENDNYVSEITTDTGDNGQNFWRFTGKISVIYPGFSERIKGTTSKDLIGRNEVPSNQKVIISAPLTCEADNSLSDIFPSGEYDTNIFPTTCCSSTCKLVSSVSSSSNNAVASNGVSAFSSASSSSGNSVNSPPVSITQKTCTNCYCDYLTSVYADADPSSGIKFIPVPDSTTSSDNNDNNGNQVALTSTGSSGITADDVSGSTQNSQIVPSSSSYNLKIGGGTVTVPLPFVNPYNEKLRYIVSITGPQDIAVRPVGVFTTVVDPKKSKTISLTFSCKNKPGTFNIYIFYKNSPFQFQNAFQLQVLAFAPDTMKNKYRY